MNCGTLPTFKTALEGQSLVIVIGAIMSKCKILCVVAAHSRFSFRYHPIHAIAQLLRAGKDQQAGKLHSVIESVKMEHRTQPKFHAPDPADGVGGSPVS
jgi:hypothetical protein